MKHISENESIVTWLHKRCGSETSVETYRHRIKRFFEHVGIEPDELVSAWKKAKYDADHRVKEKFIDEWTEKIEAYVYTNFENYAPHSRMQVLTVLCSFFKAHKISVSPDRNSKHVYVRYHNRALKREEIKRIVEHAELRDRTFFLMMVESGLRPYTLVQLRYKHIKTEFEANRIPMMIELPSELLKDRVEARWTFIGEDGFKELKKYLKPRLPLKNEDLIFAPRRSDARKPFLTRNTFTSIFSRIVLKLDIAEEEKFGKPKKVRLYGLRKYFMNNIRCDPAYREFWMCRKTTQTHYVSRDPERHREEYAAAYENLRVYKTEQPINDLKKLLVQKDKELAQLREGLAVLTPLLEFAQRNPEALRKFLSKLAPGEIRALQVAINNRTARWLDKTSRDRNVPEKVQAVARKHRERLGYM